jgi:hypothetical protein
VVEAQLLTSAVATTNGEWIEVTGLLPISFQVDGITTATIQLRGSSKPTIPSNSSDEYQLGSNITVDGLYSLDAPVRYVKVKVSSYTSGTINVYMVGYSKK